MMRISNMQFGRDFVTRLAIAIWVLAALSLNAFGQNVKQDKKSGSLTLHSEEVSVETVPGKLFGTLLLPSGNQPFPVVLIIAGSGQTDRDGNTEGADGKSDALRLVAEGLAQAGIGSLRYDKRGVAKSVGARAATNLFERQVDDGALWIEWLRKDPRVGAIGVVGHSEGALVGTLASQSGNVRAFVSLAGGGRRADEVLVEQMERAVKEGQLSKSILPGFKNSLAELRAGRTVTTRPKDLPDWLWKGLFAPRAQEYLISMFRYEPAAEIAKLPKLDVRVLVVQGTTDLTGQLDHATLLATAVGEKPAIIEGMNHELKSAPLDQKANDEASEDPKRPLAPGLLDALIPFLKRSLQVEVR